MKQDLSGIFSYQKHHSDLLKITALLYDGFCHQQNFRADDKLYLLRRVYYYMRPAIRLAAMMRQPIIYVFTHDSIGLGEDGPTHQPIEQLAALRIIPHLDVVRPADAAETVAAWLARLVGNTRR